MKGVEEKHISFPKDCFYSYRAKRNVAMRGYHNDTHLILDNYIKLETSAYGANLSVRLGGRRPLLLVE